MRKLIGNRSHHSCGSLRIDAGQALVELALMFPLFILMLVGAAEFGRLAFAGIEVSNAARAGVQYGAQSTVMASDNAGMQQAAVQDAANLAGLTATASHFCACSNGGGSTCEPTDCAGARIIEYVEVHTSATIDPLFYYPGLPKKFTLQGQATMRVAE